LDGQQNKIAPKQLLSVPDGIFLVAGMVIGVGIFKLPGLVAGNAASATHFFAAWIIGGIACLCGALVYAELASRFPETGGEYAFLRRGFGEGPAFVFAWSRMTVIQTGAIAAVSFVFGEYASQIVSFGAQSTAIWAAICVAVLTALNLLGTLQSKGLQKVMEILLITALAVIAIGGIAVGTAPSAASTAPGSGGSIALMMIFVLYTFGGWNEGAYLAGEVRDARRNMVKVLAGGIVLVTVLYLLVNLGYYRAIGLTGLKESKAIAVDTMRLIAGQNAALLVALVVCVSALTTINAAIFTGARTNWALGRDYRAFAFLGNWRESGSTPANALLLQGAIVLLLIWAGSTTRDGFEAMVAYGLPVFWSFLLLTGITLFIFRRNQQPPVFRVPLFPVVPIAFLAMCAFMVWSSFDYVANSPYGPKFGNLVLAGLVVMALGIPLYFVARRK
jgi:basic amino acid/polyamine antiporter, APA family